MYANRAHRLQIDFLLFSQVGNQPQVHAILFQVFVVVLFRYENIAAWRFAYPLV